MLSNIIKEVSELSYRQKVKNLINKLSFDSVVGPLVNDVLDNCGPETRCFIMWAAEQLKKIKPINEIKYLEVGTRRGWSAATVGSVLPTCDMYCFDMWVENYSSSPNPGPDFVQSEVTKVGYNKKINFISGDSHKTLPKFFKDNPNLELDLILVDGDHTELTKLDLDDTMPHVALGGYLIFDDIYYPNMVAEFWYELKERYPNFEYISFIGNIPGVGLAQRIK